MGDFTLPEGGAGGKLTYEYKLSGNASKTHYVTPQYTTSDAWNASWNDLPGVSTKSKSYASASVDIPSNAVKIRFRASADSGGTKSVYVKNIKVTRVSFANAPATKTLHVGTNMIGTQSSTNSTTMEWSNIAPFTYTITETDANQFSATIETNAVADGCSNGTAKIIVTYKHNIINTHTATLTINTAKGTHTIALSGTTIDKYTALLNWNIANTGNNTGEYAVEDQVALTEAYSLVNQTTNANITLPINFTIETLERNVIYKEDNDNNYNNDVISIENGVLIAKNAGKAKLIASFAGNNQYKAFTKEITLTIKKHTPTFTWKAPIYFNTTTTDFFSTNNKQTAIKIESQTDPEVANLHFNPNDANDKYTLDLTAYNKINPTTLVPYSTTIKVSQGENYYWKYLDDTKTITPIDTNNHVPFTIDSQEKRDIFDTNWESDEYAWDNGIQLGNWEKGFNYEDKYVDLHFTGIPDKLTFNTSIKNAVIFDVSDVYWYVKESEDGENWSNEIWSQEDTKEITITTPIQLNPKTRYIRLCYSGNFGGVFHNVTVTERNELVAVEVADTTKDVTTLAFDSVQVNQERKLNFALRYANAGYKVTLATEPNNNHFTISPNHFTNTIGGEKSGTTDAITVTYHPISDKDNDNCLLIISDEMGDKDTIQITASSYKARQELAWREDFREVEKPFIRLKDGQITNAATASSKLQVTYNSSNNEVITTNSDQTILIPVATGEATITASQGGNEAWHPAKSITKTFIVTDKLLQYIIWNDPLTNLVISTDNQTIPLTAQVYLQTEDETAPILSPEQTARLTYTSGNSNIVSVQGNQLTIHAVGQTTLTAHVPALGEEYAEATLTVPVIVRPETAGCEDILLYEQHDPIQFFQGNLNEIVKDPIQLDRTKGIPGYLVFDHYGLSWNLVIQYYYAEIRVEESTDNGNNWSTITTIKPVKDQTNQSKIPLSRNATHIRFARNYGGQGYQFLQNIQVYPAQFIEALDTEHRTPITEIDFGQITVGSKEERTFLIDYSNIKYELSPAPSSSEVTATPNTFGVCSGFGTETINVTWLPTQINNNATETITFTDPNSGMQTKVTLKASVAQGTQNLNWTAPTTIDNCNDVDFPTHTTADLPITWKVIEGEKHAQFVNGLLEIYSSGVITIQASHPGTKNYKPFTKEYSNIEIVFQLVFVGTENDEWENPANWAMCRLPHPTEVITIAAPATLSSHATVNGIKFADSEEEANSLHITSTGGLTIGEQGIANAADNGSSLVIDNTYDGAGFLRIDPKYQGTTRLTMRYQTKSTLDNGANSDADWQYIGAPGNDCSIYVDYNTWLYKLDEPKKDWELQARTADVDLIPFEGYAITQYGKPTYEWTANFTNANRTIPLTYSKDGRSGRHIFANSYTAPIDVKALDGLITYHEGEEDRFRIEQTVYIFNSGSWNDWNKQPQTGDDTPGQYYAIPIAAAAANYLSEEQTVIPPMQGFYMRVRSKTQLDQLDATEQVGQILLDYNTVVMGDNHKMNTAMRAPQRHVPTPNQNFQRIRIQATSANSGADRLYIIQDEINTRKYNNGYDAPNQTTNGIVNIYTNESFGKMEVSCSDNIDSLYIGFMAGEDSLYTLTFGAQRGEIYLKDLQNDSIIHMLNGKQYHFIATPHSTNDLRFQVLLHPDFNYDFSKEEKDEIITNVTDIPATQVWSDGKIVYIANAPINSTAKVFNISGQALLSTTINCMPYTLNLSHLSAGVYMLQLNNKVYKFVCK